MSRINLSGQKFGRWVVLSFANIQKQKKYWVCRCECGVVKTVQGVNMIRGLSKSCGCLRRQKIQECNNIKKVTLSSAKSSALHALRQAASSRKLCLVLSKEDALVLMESPCYYCDVKESGYSKSRAGVIFRHNGIDRIDNHLGYTKENSVPCCTDCNLAKRTLSQQEFFNLIERVYKKHFMNKRKDTVA
jgi:hypothetical protein